MYGCPRCNGTGDEGYGRDTINNGCSLCHGTGRITAGQDRLLRAKAFFVLFVIAAIAILFLIGPHFLAMINSK